MKSDPKVKRRIFINNLFRILIIVVASMALIPLVFIIFFIITKGISNINFEFIFTSPNAMGETGGGIVNALIGSIIITALASLIAIPLGIAAGIYVSEHRKERLAKIIQNMTELIQGIPSIVIGMIGFAWIVLPMKNLSVAIFSFLLKIFPNMQASALSFSGLAGGIALSFIMLPIIVKSTDETLRLIPFSLKEASLALGVPYHKTIVRVVLPSALSGIVTGILLALARVTGETAPLLITALGNLQIEWNILKPMEALPLTIYNYAISPYESWHKIGWGASFVLVCFVLLMNLITRVVVSKWKIEF